MFQVASSGNKLLMILSLPIEVANAEVLHPEKFMVYAWLCWFCDKEPRARWKVEFKHLSKLSGLSIKKLSLGVKHLELKKLIDVQRERGRIYVAINEVPGEIKSLFESRQAEVLLLEERKASAGPIPVSAILES